MKYYSTQEIARMLGIKTITVRRWIAEGKLKAYDLGKSYRVSENDIERFMRDKKIKNE